MKAVRRQPVIAVILLAGSAAAVFWRLAATNLILARGDMFLYFYPYWHAARTALLAGRLPLWNPDIFMGAPLLANSQMGFFYPLNWPFWLLLPVPYAVSGSILLHLWIALWGTWRLAGRLGMSPPARILASAAFGLGGYLTAQIEHINQLQGLAWLPWLLWVGAGVARDRNWRPGLVLFGIFLALQILAGHLQTVFISGVGLAAWLAVWSLSGRRVEETPANHPGTGRSWRPLIQAVGVLAAGGALGLLLAGVQLLPTLELTGLSSRAGGLSSNEVLSFSWHPFLIPRSLLPGYGQNLFTEYVAWLPLTVLFFAGLGLVAGRRPAVHGSLLLAGMGLFLALGRFNGLYLLLANLPGFNLFRVPARWLVLYALGISLLAGQGLDAAGRLGDGPGPVNRGRRLVWAMLPAVALIAGQFIAFWLQPWLPAAAEAPPAYPSTLALTGQLGELVLLGGWLVAGNRRLRGALFQWGSAGLVLLWLFASSRSLPFNNPTTPEAFFDRRPPSLRLQAESEGQLAPPRFLSLSDIFFDPGDQAEIDSIYGGILPETAAYDYTIAIKLKEIIAPNLSMVYGLPAVDGFDGGVLPLLSYSDLMARSLLDGRQTTDGRLREFLDSVPPAGQLSRFHIGYVLTDKVGDVWIDGVFYDRQLPARLDPGEEVGVAVVSDMEATEIRLLVARGSGRLLLTSADGQRREITPQPAGDQVWTASLDGDPRPEQVTLIAGPDGWHVEALSLVEAKKGIFLPLVAGPFALIHSGDVKIYRHTASASRARLLQAGAATLEAEQIAGTAAFKRYEPEVVTLQVTAGEPVRLVLLDADYPGWQAAVAGRPVPIGSVDGFFRAVDLPAGEHEVEFHFRPRSVLLGGWATGLGLLLVLFLGFPLPRLRRRSKAS